MASGTKPPWRRSEALRVLSRDPAGAETARSIEHALALAKEPAAHATEDIARLARSLSMTMRQSVSEFSVDPPC